MAGLLLFGQSFAQFLAHFTVSQSAVWSLHAQVEIQLPRKFIEQIGQSVARFGQVELVVWPGARVELVGPEHLRQASSPQGLLVIARVVPSAA